MNRLPNLGGCRDERFSRFSARPLRVGSNQTEPS